MREGSLFSVGAQQTGDEGPVMGWCSARSLREESCLLERRVVSHRINSRNTVATSMGGDTDAVA